MDDPNERRLQLVRKLVERAGYHVDSSMDEPNEKRLQLVRKLVERAGYRVDSIGWCPRQTAGLLGWNTPEAVILLCAMRADLIKHARSRVVNVLSRHGWRESAMTWTYEQIALERYRLTLRLPIDQATAGYQSTRI